MAFGNGSGGDLPEGTIDLLARFRVEKEKSKEALQEVTRFKQEFKSFADEVAASDRVLLRQVATLQKEQAAAAKAAKQSGSLADSEKRARSEIEQTTQAIERRNKAASSGGSALSAIGQQVRALPSLQIPGTSLSTDAIGSIARALGSLSSPEGGLPSLAQTLDLVKKKVPEVVNAIGVGPLALVGGLGALSLALQLLQSRATAATEEIQREIDVAKAFNEQRTSGTLDSITGDIQTDQERLAKLGADLETARQAYALTIQEVLKNPPAKITVGAIQDALNLDTPLHRTKLALDAAQKAYDSASAAIELETGLLNDEGVIRNSISELQDKYNKQLDASAPKLAQLNAQQQQLIDSFEEQTRQRQQDAALQRRFQTEDRQLADEKSAQQHQATLADIYKTGQERIAGIVADGNASLVDLQSKLADTLGKIAGDAQQSIADETDKFRNDELENGRKFRKAEDRVNAQYLKERIRRTQDNAQALFDAELQNDTAAFIQAKQRARTEEQRAQQDFEDAKQQRLQDFNDERQQRQQAKNERIADIQAEAAEKARTAQEEFAKENTALRAKTADAIAQENAAIDERVKKEVAAYNKSVDEEIAARERADARAAILDGIQEQRRQDAHNASLAQIEERKQAEQGLANTILAQINTLQARINNISYPQPPRSLSSLGYGGLGVAGYPMASNFLSSFPGTSSGSGGLQGGLRAFAQSGVVDKPTLALMGERPGYKDVILSAPSNESMAQTLARHGAGPAVVFNHYGDIRTDDQMTRGEFKTEMTTILTEIMEGNAAARYGRLP